MWRMPSFFLFLLFLGLSLGSLSAEEPILVYPEELERLIQLSQNLVNKNTLLQAELEITLQQSQEWETIYKSLIQSWEQYKQETLLEQEKLQKKIKIQKVVIIIIGIGIPVSFIAGGMLF